MLLNLSRTVPENSLLAKLRTRENFSLLLKRWPDDKLFILHVVSSGYANCWYRRKGDLRKIWRQMFPPQMQAMPFPMAR